MADLLLSIYAARPDDAAPLRGETCALVSNAGVLARREYGAAIDAKNKYGGTPLHAAAYYGKKETAVPLVGLGADATVKNNNGQGATIFKFSLQIPRIVSI